ncbi:Kruppel-like factor 18 [Pipistrellus kuhlii]|uniref:Kruppel-like factor 18 n=1 Tax=Pipistrellus kuhlii TaxID=59472 RepID=UPI00174F5846|nr:Kruppel-like factor 18 [Pipistrellus kuhlii]
MERKGYVGLGFESGEDLVQLSGNCEDTHSLPQEIEEFLEEYYERLESRTPAAPEPQSSVPLTGCGDESQHESIQSQVTTPMISADSNIPETVLDQNSTMSPVNAFGMPTGELSETASVDQKVTSFDQRKPTATSSMMGVTDNPKTLFTDCQKTTITANNMTVSKEGSQMITFSGDQTRFGCQITFSGDQIHYGGQMPFGGDQTRYGGQMPFGGDQTRYKGQMPFGWDQTCYGGQMPFSGDQTRQVTTYSPDQTLYGGQMVTLKEEQIKAFNHDHTLYGSHMKPSQSSSLPNPGLPHCSSSHLTQGQSLEEQKSELKTQSRQFKKNLKVSKRFFCKYEGCDKSYSKVSYLQIHYRNHIGEKPYNCEWKGCTWKFTRLDALNRHKSRHTGERPHRCHICDKRFKRSDHLKQHMKSHH